MDINRILIVTIVFLMCLSANSLMAVEETGGIGLKVSQLYNYSTKEEDKRGSIVVLDVFKGSPAHRRGIEKGDLIIKVNGQLTRKNDFYEILENHLRGPAHTDVELILWRPAANERMEVIIRRVPMVY